MLASRKAAQRFAVVIAVVAFSLLGAATTQAASVAYLDGNEVWVATTDGATRARLSSGEGDWRAVAQSDQGYIVGVRNEAGKLSTFSLFVVWDPAGNRIHFGPLAGRTGASSIVYPLSLDITPDGRLLVYGFSDLTGFYPTTSLVQGHYLLPSSTVAAPVPEPLKNTSIRWPTLVGERIIGTPDEVFNAVQDTTSIASTNFLQWFGFSSGPGSPEIHRTDIAAISTVIAAEVNYPGATPQDDVNKIAVLPSTGLGVWPSPPGDCFLDADAKATQPSVSQDATLIAWQDGGGVKVGGVPTFSGAEPCVLTKPPVTISPTGSYPSIGPFNVVALVPAPAPASKPTLTAPKSVKLSKLLKSGLTVRVSSVTGGKATVKMTVKPKSVGKKGRKAIVIASGSAVVPAGGIAKKIKLKMTRKGKSLKRRLKGKRATLTATIGGLSSSKTIKLK